MHENRISNSEVQPVQEGQPHVRLPTIEELKSQFAFQAMSNFPQGPDLVSDGGIKLNLPKAMPGGIFDTTMPRNIPIVKVPELISFSSFLNRNAESPPPVQTSPDTIKDYFKKIAALQLASQQPK
jgi:hypothetical protein